MIRKILRRWLAPQRDASGKFISNRAKVLAKCAQMRRELGLPESEVLRG
jgi:hypothetical protein